MVEDAVNGGPQSEEIREREIGSVEEALDAVVDSGLDKATTPWFRGQRRSVWEIKPLFDRVEIRGEQRLLLNDFEVAAARFVGRPFQGAWEVMVLAQHHRIPTRLLDWTTSIHVGLHFAVERLAPDSDGVDDDSVPGALFAMDPAAFNRDTLDGLGEVLMFGRTVHLEEGSLKAQILTSLDPTRSGAESVSAPFAVAAPHSFERIGNQSGTFIACPAGSRPLRTFLREGTFEKWIVPAGAKERIRRQLQAAGFTQFRLFPTLDNAAQEVRRRYVAEPEEGGR